MGTVYTAPKAFLYPPQTLATVAASLRDAGCQVRASDAVIEQPLQGLAEADVVGVFVSYATLDTDIAFIRGLRERVPAALVAFGPAMRFVGRDVLARAPVDAVLVGEAEVLLAAALEHLGPDSDLPRMLTSDNMGVQCCDEEGLVQDLDTLPFPAWDLLAHEEYGLLTVLGSRGCPDKCAYCPYVAAQGHRFRVRSGGSVLAELAWLNERFHPARVVFRDPVFAHDREHVVAICEGILRQQLSLRWECESRPEHFDAQLIRLMKRAGCQWIKIGLETTDGALLVRLRRIDSAKETAAYLQHVTDTVEACNAAGVYCRLFAMAGLPGQDEAMAQHTRRFVEELRPTALNVKLFTEYPGTDLEAAAQEDCAAQMDILHQAQEAVQSFQAAPLLMTRVRRWLRNALRGGTCG